MSFDPASLVQSWPAPSNPRPVVTFGAGSIVGDGHYPAYRKSGIPIAGLYDPDQDKAGKVAEAWGVAAFGSESSRGRWTSPAGHRHLGKMDQPPHWRLH